MNTTNSAFINALNFTLRWEGGYSNHPADKGGETNYGITHAVYDSYRKGCGLKCRSVRLIERHEVEHIYQVMYWNIAGCNLMPPKLAMCHFDWAVNSGCSRAIKTLQKVVGATPDGIIGPITKNLLKHMLNVNDESTLISGYNNIREHYYRSWAVGNQRQFLDGWLNRLSDLRRLVS